MVPIIPVELLPEVVSHLSKTKDFATLQNLAISSSVFRQPCQEELFSSIMVTRGYKASHYDLGIEIFRRSNGLLAFVKAVAVGDRHTHLTESPADWAMLDLLNILSSPSLKEFSFTGWWCWDATDFQSAIIALIRSPNLTHLRLTCAPLEFADYAQSTSIHHLTLLGVEEYDSWHEDMQPFCPPFPPTHQQPCQNRLTSLIIDVEAVGSLSYNRKRFDISGVEQLKLRSGYRNATSDMGVSRLLSLCGHSLRVMHIDSTGEHPASGKQL